MSRLIDRGRGKDGDSRATPYREKVVKVNVGESDRRCTDETVQEIRCGEPTEALFPPQRSAAVD